MGLVAFCFAFSKFLIFMCMQTSHFKKVRIQGWSGEGEPRQHTSRYFEILRENAIRLPPIRVVSGPVAADFPGFLKNLPIFLDESVGSLA
jgi:hypothetical protein